MNGSCLMTINTYQVWGAWHPPPKPLLHTDILFASYSFKWLHKGLECVCHTICVLILPIEPQTLKLGPLACCLPAAVLGFPGSPLCIRSHRHVTPSWQPLRVCDQQRQPGAMYPAALPLLRALHPCCCCCCCRTDSGL